GCCRWRSSSTSCPTGDLGNRTRPRLADDPLPRGTYSARFQPSLHVCASGSFSADPNRGQPCDQVAMTQAWRNLRRPYVMTVSSFLSGDSSSPLTCSIPRTTTQARPPSHHQPSMRRTYTHLP